MRFTENKRLHAERSLFTWNAELLPFAFKMDTNELVAMCYFKIKIVIDVQMQSCAWLIFKKREKLLSHMTPSLMVIG